MPFCFESDRKLQQGVREKLRSGFPNSSTGICKFAQHIQSRCAIRACSRANRSGTLLVTQRWKPKRDASQGRIRRGDVSRITRRSLRLRCLWRHAPVQADSSTRWAKARGEALATVYCQPLVHASSSPERRKTRSVAAQATKGMRARRYVVRGPREGPAPHAVRASPR